MRSLPDIPLEDGAAQKGVAHEQSYQTALEEVREEKKEESLDLTASTYAYRLRGGRLFAHGLLNIFRTHFQRKE